MKGDREGKRKGSRAWAGEGEREGGRGKRKGLRDVRGGREEGREGENGKGKEEGKELRAWAARISRLLVEYVGVREAKWVRFDGDT